MGFSEAFRYLRPKEWRINAVPTGIESLAFERVGGDINLRFDTGVHSVIHVIPRGHVSLSGGDPLPDPVITISFSVPASEKYRRDHGLFYEPRGKIILRRKGELEIQDGVPITIQRAPVAFSSHLIEMLEELDPRRVYIDSNWGWHDETRDEKIRGAISEYTTPIREWLAYKATPPAPPANG